MNDIISIKTVANFNKFLGVEKPKHPLISVIHHDNKKLRIKYNRNRVVSDLYCISLRNSKEDSFGYGRNSYDFDEGSLVFTKPGQVMILKDIDIDKVNRTIAGWTLTFHPDLLRKSLLSTKMDSFNYFSYSVNEALQLSVEEQNNLSAIVKKIERETVLNIDRKSQAIMVACIELLLNYCDRYYDRQFYIRTNINNDVVSRFEKLIQKYFNSGKALELGVPSVKYCGKALNMSPSYLSDLLNKETGKSAYEHIYYYLIEKAKNSLLNTNKPVSEIAYSLGFEYSQHFSKVFKLRTGMSPSEYRKLN